MKQPAKQLFQQCEMSTDEVLYTFIKLPLTHWPEACELITTQSASFGTLMRDKHELTLLIPQNMWDNMRDQLPSAEQAGAFRLISFDCVLTLDVVGFLAVVTDILAQAEIPLLAFSAFSRDHIFVASEHFEQAWQSLKMAQVNDKISE